MNDDIRTLLQNDKLWPMLRDVAKQVEWPVDGVLQRIEDWEWKVIFTAALKKHQRVAAGIDGGFVMLGESTSRMKKKDMAELIELIYAFGADKGVVWTDPEYQALMTERAA